MRALLRCLFGKHVDMRVFENGRMFMECEVCGRQSKGIEVPTNVWRHWRA